MKLSCLPAFLILLCITLASCVHVPGQITAVGGKGAYKNGKVTLVYNNEKSFRDGALALVAAVGSVASAVTQSAAETTAQVSSTNAANVANTQTAATAGVQTATITAKKEVALETIKAGAAQ